MTNVASSLQQTMTLEVNIVFVREGQTTGSDENTADPGSRDRFGGMPTSIGFVVE